MSLSRISISLSGPGALPTVREAQAHIDDCPEHDVVLWIELQDMGASGQRDDLLRWSCLTCMHAKLGIRP